MVATIGRLLDGPLAGVQRGPVELVVERALPLLAADADGRLLPAIGVRAGGCLGWRGRVGTVVVAGDGAAADAVIDRATAVADSEDGLAGSAGEVAGVEGSVVVGTLCSTGALSVGARPPEDPGEPEPPARTALNRTRLTRPSTTRARDRLASR